MADGGFGSKPNIPLSGTLQVKRPGGLHTFWLPRRAHRTQKTVEDLREIIHEVPEPTVTLTPVPGVLVLLDTLGLGQQWGTGHMGEGGKNQTAASRQAQVPGDEIVRDCDCDALSSQCVPRSPSFCSFAPLFQLRLCFVRVDPPKNALSVVQAELVGRRAPRNRVEHALFFFIWWHFQPPSPLDC